MATEYFKFTGKSKWAKVYDAEEFRGSTNWKIDVALDKASLALYKKSGIQGKLKDLEDGTFATFKRPKYKMIKGTTNEFGGPKIVDKDDSVMVEYIKGEDGNGGYVWVRKGTPTLIGNGSEVEVTVAVYDTQMGKGQRLESVKVLDLIEYSPAGGYDSIVKGNTDAPEVGTVKTPWD